MCSKFFFQIHIFFFELWQSWSICRWSMNRFLLTYHLHQIWLIRWYRLSISVLIFHHVFFNFVELNYIFYPFLNFFFLWRYSHDQSSFEFSFDFNLLWNIVFPYLFFEYYYAFFDRSFQSSSSSISSLSFFRPFQIRRKQYYFESIHESCSFPLLLLIVIRLRLTLSSVVFFLFDLICIEADRILLRQWCPINSDPALYFYRLVMLDRNFLLQLLHFIIWWSSFFRDIVVVFSGYQLNSSL